MEDLPYHLVQDFFHQQWLLSILAKYLEPLMQIRVQEGATDKGIIYIFIWDEVSHVCICSMS